MPVMYCLASSEPAIIFHTITGKPNYYYHSICIVVCHFQDPINISTFVGYQNFRSCLSAHTKEILINNDLIILISGRKQTRFQFQWTSLHNFDTRFVKNTARSTNNKEVRHYWCSFRKWLCTQFYARLEKIKWVKKNSVCRLCFCNHFY